MKDGAGKKGARRLGLSANDSRTHCKIDDVGTTASMERRQILEGLEFSDMC